MQPDIKILRRNWKLELSDSRDTKKGNNLTANRGNKNDTLVGKLGNIAKLTLRVNVPIDHLGIEIENKM